MRLLGAFLWHCDSDGAKALRTGVLAVLAGAAIALSGLILDDVVFQPTRELPGKWVAGHFQSEPFWVAWRASRYVISVELPDTVVPTEDLDSSTQHFTQRCGQPFPNGITWSVRHLGRVIARQSGQLARIGLPAVISLYVLLTLGSICLALGGVLMLMERLQITQRLQRYLQGRRDNNPAS